LFPDERDGAPERDREEGREGGREYKRGMKEE